MLSTSLILHNTQAGRNHQLANQKTDRLKPEPVMGSHVLSFGLRLLFLDMLHLEDIWVEVLALGLLLKEVFLVVQE